MSQKPELGNKNNNRSKLPESGKRTPILVKEGPALSNLDSWIDSQLELLTKKFANFESPSSNKKYFAR